MIGLLQRVNSARVTVNGADIGCIKEGLLVLVAIEPKDTQRHPERLLHRLLGYRIFEDTDGKMNLSLTEINGGLLLVPQFTLAADTQKGMRPSFTPAASPELGETLFNYLCLQARQRHHNVANGQFSANMQVSLTNDGPATFWLQVP